MCKCANAGLMCKCENVRMCKCANAGLKRECANGACSPLLWLRLGYKDIKPFTHLHIVSVLELEKVVSREQSLVGSSKLCC